MGLRSQQRLRQLIWEEKMTARRKIFFGFWKKSEKTKIANYSQKNGKNFKITSGLK